MIKTLASKSASDSPKFAQTLDLPSSGKELVTTTHLPVFPFNANFKLVRNVLYASLTVKLIS